MLLTAGGRHWAVGPKLARRAAKSGVTDCSGSIKHLVTFALIIAATARHFY